MIKLRLTRTGKKNSATYRLIAVEARSKRDGKALEYLGFYDPKTKPSTIKLDADRIKYWLSQGAQPSETVNNILIKHKLAEKPKNKKVFQSKPGKKRSERLEKAEADKAKAAQAKPAEETAAPVEEAAPAATEEAAA